MQKRMDIRNFYIDEEFKPIYEEFKKICDREGDSISSKIRGFIERYVVVHSEGNPQLTIIKFIEDVKLRECFFCRGRFEKLFKVEYVSGLVAPTCKVCLNRNKEKGVFSTVKRVLGFMK